MPPQKHPKVDYLRVYPGLNDFSDALEAIPQTAAKFITHLNHVRSRSDAPQLKLRDTIDEYFQTRNTDTLRDISERLAKLLPTMEEKMRAAEAAAKQLTRQVSRLDADYDMICEHEIPTNVQFDLSDPAFYELVPQDRAVNPRTQARREAREARETRRVAQQNAEAKSNTPAPTPEPVLAPTGRRRGRTPLTTTKVDVYTNGPAGSAEYTGDQEATARAQENPSPTATPSYESDKPSRQPGNTRSQNQHIPAANHDASTTETKREVYVPPVVMPMPAPAPAPAPDSEEEVLLGMKRKRGSAPKSSEPVYCYCEQGSYGEMVGCDGPQCEREWFHLGCIGLSALPKGQWFCEECRAKLRRR